MRTSHLVDHVFALQQQCAQVGSLPGLTSALRPIAPLEQSHSAESARGHRPVDEGPSHPTLHHRQGGELRDQTGGEIRDRRHRLRHHYHQRHLRTDQPASNGLAVPYRIDANPVRKPGHTTRAATGAKAVIPLSGTDADDWWARQAEERSGLKLTSTHTTPLTAARGERRQDKHHIRHTRTRFEGTAVVTDRITLQQHILEGIGRGKSYGCGLLSLAPLANPAR
ncbi:type I-E CRISPR-associated protein Cas6/Cse3/CasE [Streptomyces mirabilis]|uniref:type I-E CRISPR-associated protein Cas6/Cse3/CasE n=1 Tax=Streptomyces mirabilis TaxID=68239 RepID=UPI0036CC3F82